MYSYKIGYWTCEESSYLEVQHEKVFTEVELTEIVSDIVVEVINLTRKTKDYNISNFKSAFHNEHFLRLLIDKYKFVEVKYEQEISYFGWFSIFGGDNWKTYKDDNDNKLIEKVNKGGYTFEKDDYIHLLRGKIEAEDILNEVNLEDKEEVVDEETKSSN